MRSFFLDASVKRRQVLPRMPSGAIDDFGSCQSDFHFSAILA